MDLQTRKITFIQEFLQIQNEEIIYGLESFLKKQKNELLERKTTPMSIGDLESEINQALDDSENDRVIEATALKSKYN